MLRLGAAVCLGYFCPRTKPLDLSPCRGLLHHLCPLRTLPESAGLQKTHFILGSLEGEGDFLSEMGLEPCGSQSVWGSLKAQGCFPVH